MTSNISGIEKEPVLDISFIALEDFEVQIIPTSQVAERLAGAITQFQKTADRNSPEAIEFAKRAMCALNELRLSATLIERSLGLK